MSERLTVLNDTEAPPGGWQLTIAETGVTIRATYATTLKGRVLAHMNANSLPIPDDFDAWVEDAMCRESGHGQPFCGGAPPPLAPISGPVTMQSVKRCLFTMIQLLRDRKVVMRHEAERRVRVCESCPYAVEVGACWACVQLMGALRLLLKKNRIVMAEDKQWCGRCSCFIPAKAWLQNGTLNKVEKGQIEYWERCWRYDEEANH